MYRTKELWAPIENYPNYEVSSLGEVYNVKFNRYVKDSNCRGYRILQLSHLGKVKTFQVHRLVALAFIPKQDNKDYVNHIDGNKQNNCVDNLEWCTQSENVKHSYNSNLRVPPSQKAIQVIETGEIFFNISQCARALGVYRENIRKCLRNDRLHTCGYSFRYVTFE